MKQIIKFAISLALSLACITARASGRSDARQEWRDSNPERYSVTLSISGYPLAEDYIYCPTNNRWEGTISYLYSDYRGKVLTTGVIGGEFNWNISRWLNASGYLGVCPMWNNVYDGFSGLKTGRDVCVGVHVLPKIKLMWGNTSLVRAYTSLSLGVSMYPGKCEGNSFFQPAFQLNLIGLEIGRKWFGFFEIGAGTVFVGGKAGFGFRF